jgi:acyl dehydratase
MGVTSRHILQQGPVLSALGRTALRALRQRIAPTPEGAAPTLPGPEFHRTRAPLPRTLIDDYVAHVGGDPRAYRGELPPHLFPQWCMPALARTLEAVPYPLLRVVNGGCKVRVLGAIPDGEPLEVRARLVDIDDDGRRAVLHQTLTTGTRSAPEALAIDFYAIVPLGRGNGKSAGKGAGNGADKDAANGGEGAKKERARVPEQAREIARIRLDHDAGLGFAKLTGDFNPIHWLAPYARASGFPDVILHGFGSLALAWEALNRNLFGGDVHALASFDVKLARPLVLPHDVSVYVQGGEVFVGDAPGGPAYLTGLFQVRGES